MYFKKFIQRLEVATLMGSVAVSVRGFFLLSPDERRSGPPTTSTLIVNCIATPPHLNKGGIMGMLSRSKFTLETKFNTSVKWEEETEDKQEKKVRKKLENHIQYIANQLNIEVNEYLMWELKGQLGDIIRINGEVSKFTLIKGGVKDD
jgi:hypothetical protein